MSARLLMGCLLGGVLAACSETTPPQPQPGTQPSLELPTQLPLPPSGARIAGRVRRLSAFQDQLRTQIDPASSAWHSEVLALELESSLSSAIAAWFRQQELAPLRQLLAEDFQGASSLVLAAGGPRYEEGNLVVEDAPASTTSSVEAPERFAEQCQQWRASFGAQRFESVELQIYRCDANHELQSEVDCSLRIHTREGQSGLQQNLRCRLLVAHNAQGREARLQRWTVLSNQRVLAKAPIFEERTRDVLGSLACFEEELLRGSGDYHLRQDRLSLQPFLGMHGIAVGDPNGDGLEDLYLPQPGGQPNRLFLREPSGLLRDASNEFGVALLDNTGPAFFADLDGDGDQDLAMAIGGTILLRWNDDSKSLRRGVVLRGPDEAEITSMSAADFDKDGDLDLYACRYVRGGVAGGAPVPYHNAQNGAKNLYWRNDGRAGFVEAAREVGLDQHSERYTLALYIEDFNEDGWIDLYAVNDFGRNCLYLNEAGRFRDVAPERGVIDQAAGMGADMDDANGDGRLDLYNTNMHSPAGSRIAAHPRFLPLHPELRPDYTYHARGNTLLLAQADGSYLDATLPYGVADAGWAWGARFLDFGNDSWPDIFVPNGFASNPRRDDLDSFFWREVIARTNFDAEPSAEYGAAWDAIRHFTMFEGWSWNGWERKYAYLNLGGTRYADVSAVARLDFLDDMRAAATIDWDEDGRMDLLLRNRTGPRVRLMINEQRTSNHYLKLELASQTANREAIGAQAYVRVGGRTLRRSVQIAQGFMCASSRRLHFPLGQHRRIEELLVRWPDGSEQRFDALAADRHYRLVQGQPLQERAARPAPALRAQPAQASEHAVMQGASRMVLYDKLPLSPLGLPLAGANPRRVAEFAGKALILSLVTGSDARSKASLRQLAQAQPKFQQYPIEHVVEFWDETAQQAHVLEQWPSWQVNAAMGFATPRLKQLIEVALIEVLGPFESLPQPLHLIFDKGGNLVAIHAAPEDYQRVLQDAATASFLDPNDRGTEALLGGDWGRKPSRDLDKVAEVLRALGNSEWAQFFAKEHERRRTAPR